MPGKSTFIKLLAGIFLQDKGEVRVYDVSNLAKIHSLVKFVLEAGRGCTVIYESPIFSKLR